MENNRKSFIEANTIEMTFEEIKNEYIIPVFDKDNETLISHTEFIETAYRINVEFFPRETILKPDIRLSHPGLGPMESPVAILPQTRTEGNPCFKFLFSHFLN